jgi:FLVCR family MFS transporter 7
MLVSVSPIVGIAIGSILPPSIVSQDSDIPLLLLVIAIIASVAGIASTIFMKDKPKHPPSLLFSQNVMDPFVVGLKKVIKVKPYLILLFSFGTGVGVFNAVATILLQIIAPSGYNGIDRN